MNFKNLRLGMLLMAGFALSSAIFATALEPDGGATVPQTDMPAGNWVHVGCIQLGADCFDVFEDNKGRLWVCEECFTTQNPNPGKCRKLTAQEIANAAWCA